jgi:hypothetical protein
VPEFNQPQKQEEKDDDMTEDTSFNNEDRLKPKKPYRGAEPSERNSETDEHVKTKHRPKAQNRERTKKTQVEGQTSNHEESLPTLEQTKDTKDDKKPMMDSKVQKVTAMEIIKKNLDQV